MSVGEGLRLQEFVREQTKLIPADVTDSSWIYVQFLSHLVHGTLVVVADARPDLRSEGWCVHCTGPAAAWASTGGVGFVKTLDVSPHSYTRRLHCAGDVGLLLASFGEAHYCCTKFFNFHVDCVLSLYLHRHCTHTPGKSRPGLYKRPGSVFLI